jgi:nitrite reductase (NO-forming)
MRNRWFVGVSALAVILAIAAAMGGGGFGARAQTAATAPCAHPAASPSASPSALPTGSPVASPTAACTPTPAVTSVTIEAHDLYFTPKEITLPANTTVKLTIKNAGALPHDLTIDALGIASGVIAPGKSITVTIKAAPGSYQFYCNQPGHRFAGMIGTLIVK